MPCGDILSALGRPSQPSLCFPDVAINIEKGIRYWASGSLRSTPHNEMVSANYVLTRGDPYVSVVYMTFGVVLGILIVLSASTEKGPAHTGASSPSAATKATLADCPVQSNPSEKYRGASDAQPATVSKDAAGLSFVSGQVKVTDFSTAAFPPSVSVFTSDSAKQAWLRQYRDLQYVRHHLIRVKGEWTCMRSLGQHVSLGPYDNDYGHCFRTEKMEFVDGKLRNSCEWPLPRDFSPEPQQTTFVDPSTNRKVNLIQGSTLIMSGVYPWMGTFQHLVQDAFPQIAKSLFWLLRQTPSAKASVLLDESSWFSHVRSKYMSEVQIVGFNAQDYFCAKDSIIGFHEPYSVFGGVDAVGVEAAHRLLHLDFPAREIGTLFHGVDLGVLGGAQRSYDKSAMNTLPNSVFASPKEKNLVIYMGRPNTSNRKVDNDAAVSSAIDAVVKEFNSASNREFQYEYVYYKEPLQDKDANIDLFQRARVVVGLHGGAWANFLFTPMDARVVGIELLMGGRHARNWKNLVLASGATYIDQMIPCPDNQRDCNPDSTGVKIPTNDVEVLVKSAMMSLEKRLARGDFE
eukprot:ANDGO_01476.mRNA.1 hypothetical protein